MTTSLLPGEPSVAYYKEGNTQKALLAIGGQESGQLFFYNTDKVEELITALKTELVGTASENGDTLGKLEKLIETLNGDETTEGSVKKTVKDAVDDEVTARDAAIETAVKALNVKEITEAGQAIVAVSETDGKISATAGDIDASHVIQDAASGDKEAVTVKQAITTLRETVSANKITADDKSMIVTPGEGETTIKVAVAEDEKVFSASPI